MRLWLLQHADLIAAGFVLANAAILAFFALRWHTRATSPTSQDRRRNVVEPSRATPRAGNPFTTWQDGRRG